MYIRKAKGCLAALIISALLTSATGCGVSPLAAPTPGAPSPLATSFVPTPGAQPAVTAMVGTAVAGGTAVVVPPTGGAGTPTPFPTAPGTVRTVTLDDSGKTVDLRVGQRFLLALGPGWDWSVAVSDPSVVSRVVNITVLQGAQGVYEAKRPGRTALSAVGDLPCRKSQPPCLAPSRVFEVEILVR